MRKNPTNLHGRSLLFVTSATLASCGVFGSDDERYEKLDRLRVLAVRSEPADLSFGETATLGANVYEPAGRELSYEWSWCPSRADGAGAFECNVSESALQRAWAAAGMDGPPPAYALGTDPEVQFTHLLTPLLVAALCQTPGDDGELDEQLVLACFAGFEPSIKLTVRSSEDELTAIKSLSLLMSETPALERNANPTSDFAVSVRDDADGSVVESDQPLRAGHEYTVTAELDEAVAESFTPSALAGEPQPGPRRETLVMSWFVTVGELVVPDESNGFGNEAGRTTFVDGSNAFGDFLKNGWKLPLTAGSAAELRLVLRDERGGTGWTARSFEVVGGRQ
jgi:hypothetical protein